MAYENDEETAYLFGRHGSIHSFHLQCAMYIIASNNSIALHLMRIPIELGREKASIASYYLRGFQLCCVEAICKALASSFVAHRQLDIPTRHHQV
jgi:hypothetical protein